MLSRWILDKKLAGLPPKKKLSKLHMDSGNPPGLHMESVAEGKVLLNNTNEDPCTQVSK